MRVLGGLLELFAAGVIAWLWIHGDLTRALQAAASLVQSPPPPYAGPNTTPPNKHLGGK